MGSTITEIISVVFSETPNVLSDVEMFLVGDRLYSISVKILRVLLSPSSSVASQEING